MSSDIFFGKGSADVYMLPKLANRHGIIAGATGTGKTVSLQVLAEGFSKLGVPVFMADVKGDLSGISQPGGGKPKLEERAKQIGLTDYTYSAFPVVYWDVFGELGHPIRTTITEMGPLLISRLMDLNDTQEGVLNIAFRVADDNGLLLLDLKDIRSMLTFLADHAAEIKSQYGNVSSATVGAIQRSLLTLEEQGGEHFFGEPAFELTDLMKSNSDGRGTISILAADKLMTNPRLYATFLLWLLSELFEELPEVGDLDQPKLVFFFDEAHLLFDGAPKALLEKVEQVVRLIRSKGVGVYFVTQNPADIPDDVLAQLSNRVQHALRAFTPKEMKGIKAASESFRENPAFKTDEVITQLAVGEALVSMLQADGTPMVVDRTLVRPPSSRLGPALPNERTNVLTSSPFRGKYDEPKDRESAFEVLEARAIAMQKKMEEQEQLEAQTKMQKEAEKEAAKQERAAARTGGGRRSDSLIESLGKSVLRSAGSSLGRTIMRGILGGISRR